MRILNLTELGAAIRAARNAKGMSQAELALSVGTKQEWISRLENGRLPNPGLASVMQACTAVDLAISIEGAVLQPSIHRGGNDTGDLALSDPPFLKRP